MQLSLWFVLATHTLKARLRTGENNMYQNPRDERTNKPLQLSRLHMEA